MTDPTLALFDSLADEGRKTLNAEFVSRDRTIAETGDVLRQALSSIRSRGWQTHEAVWNSSLFLNTVAADLSVLVQDLMYQRDKWRRRLTARWMALLLYEILDDLPTVFGRAFRESSRRLGVPDTLLRNLNDKMKALVAVGKAHESMLVSVRTIAAAHRDHDAGLLLDTIDQLDLTTMIDVAQKVGSLLNELGAATQAVMSYASNVAPPELATRPLP